MIDKETIERIMKAGNDAFLNGKPDTANPHNRNNSDEHRLWLRGYCNARHAQTLNEAYARY